MDATNNYQLTKSNKRQTNFCFIPRALYQVSFSNFSNVIHYIQKLGNKYKIKWTKKKIKKEKSRKERELEKEENDEEDLKYIVDIK